MDDTHSDGGRFWDDTQHNRASVVTETTTSPLAEHIVDAWYQTDARGVIVAVNAAACRLLNAPSPSIVNSALIEWADVDSVVPLREALSTVYRTGTSVRTLLVHLRTITGESRFVDLSISPVRRSADSVVGFTGIIREVTELADDVAPLLTRIAELEALEAIRAQFVQIVTHDLRNPLTLAMGYLDILEESMRATPEQEEYLEHIRRAHQRISELTSDGLTLEQTYTNRRPAQNPVLLDLLARKAVIDFRPYAQRLGKQITFVLDLPHDEITVLGEESILFRAIANLVSNAVKYTPSSGKITLKLHKTDDQWAVFTVQDSGVGIPDEYHARLFTAFSRIRTPETALVEGSGLGLYIVKRIVEWHDGRVFFTSTYGKGSTFGFQIPLARPSVES